jgi:hypothetical protein
LRSLRIARAQSELRRYLGLAQWLHDNIPGLSFKTALLSKIAAGTGNTVLKWSPEALEQFEFVKKMRHPIRLATYNYNKTSILYTDACAEGLGAMLSQYQDDGSDLEIIDIIDRNS